MTIADRLNIIERALSRVKWEPSTEALAELALVREQVAGMEKALRPFAEIRFPTGPNGLVTNWDADVALTAAQGERLRWGLNDQLKWSDFKSARTAIASPGKEPTRG